MTQRLIWIGLLALTAGCGAPPQSALEEERLVAKDASFTTASRIQARPLRVSFAPPEDWPEMKGSLWEKYIEEWRATFAKALVRELKDREVTLVDATTTPAGVGLDAEIIEIIKGPGGPGGENQLRVKLKITDAVSHEVLYEATVRTKGGGGTFKGRCRRAARDLALPAAHAVRNGELASGTIPLEAFRVEEAAPKKRGPKAKETLEPEKPSASED